MAKKTEQKYIKWFGIFMGILLVIILIFLVFRQIDDFQQQNDPQLDRLRTVFTEFFSQDKKWEHPLDMLNSRNIPREVNIYKGRKSYAINKEKIYLCLKDPEGKYYSENMLIYVLAHEYAHCLSKSIGHTEEFWANFKFMLECAKESGEYTPVDYKAKPKTYCGMKITDNPYYDL